MRELNRVDSCELIIFFFRRIKQIRLIDVLVVRVDSSDFDLGHVPLLELPVGAEPRISGHSVGGVTISVLPNPENKSRNTDALDTGSFIGLIEHDDSSNVSGWNNVGVVDGALSLLDVWSVVIVGREKIESGFHGFQFELSERGRAVHIDLVLVGQDGSGLEESSAGELGRDLLVKSITGFDGNLVFSRDSLEATTTVSDSQSLDCLSS